MKWIFILFMILLSGPVKVVVISNSIDHSPELIEYIEQEFEVISITAQEFSDYQGFQYFVILGGPDAPEGVGDIVQGILTAREVEYLRSTEEFNLFIRVKDGKTFFVLAGADREMTKNAVTDLKDNILSYIPKSPIKWGDSLDEALLRAGSEDKLVYVDFYTDWCTYCIEMDEKAYTDPRIITLLTEEFVPVKLNREHRENEDIVKKYNVYGQPIQLVLTPDGEAVWSHRGYLDADELYLYLKSILSQKKISLL